MKKSILAAASVLALAAAMPAYADDNSNTSSVEQLGEAISATVTQGGVDNVNDSMIQQGLGGGGENLSANVSQDGDTVVPQVSVITQDGEDAFAEVTQTGVDNDNFSEIHQMGEGNSATVLQDGDTAVNSSTIYQDGTDSGIPNLANVSQSGEDVINNSMIDQSGEGNNGIVVQNGEDTTNDSFLVQAGELNEAHVTQGGIDNSNLSNVNQSGEGNYVNVTQN